MATTRSNVLRHLRAAISHRNATTILHSHYRLHHYHHSSPTSFLHSHPSNTPMSNQLLFSRSVHTRATALHKRRRSYHRVWPYSLTLACITTGGILVFYKYRQRPKLFVTVSDEMGFRIFGSVPNLYRRGHSVVVECLLRPVIKENKDWKAFEVYLSATEVLDQPPHVAAAAIRNTIILAVKQNASTNLCTTPIDEIAAAAVVFLNSESGGGS